MDMSLLGNFTTWREMSAFEMKKYTLNSEKSLQTVRKFYQFCREILMIVQVTHLLGWGRGRFLRSHQFCSLVECIAFPSLCLISLMYLFLYYIYVSAGCRRRIIRRQEQAKIQQAWKKVQEEKEKKKQGKQGQSLCTFIYDNTTFINDLCTLYIQCYSLAQYDIVKKINWSCLGPESTSFFFAFKK